MLVLTRRVGESIRIGDRITLRVLEVQRGQVRFAIEAPREIPVHREEIYLQVQEENRRAAAAAKGVDPTSLWRRTRGDGS
jgi:carbon storage regulator